MSSYFRLYFLIMPSRANSSFCAVIGSILRHVPPSLPPLSTLIALYSRCGINSLAMARSNWIYTSNLHSFYAQLMLISILLYVLLILLYTIIYLLFISASLLSLLRVLSLSLCHFAAVTRELYKFVSTLCIIQKNEYNLLDHPPPFLPRGGYCPRLHYV